MVNNILREIKEKTMVASKKIQFTFIVLSLAGVLAWANPAIAVPLPALTPAPVAGSPIQGQSDISVSLGSGSPINVDWSIEAGDFTGGGSAFTYFYQVENASGNPDLSSFTVNTTALGVVSAGFIVGDLDLAGGVWTAHSLGGAETEVASGVYTGTTFATIASDGSSVSYTFNGPKLLGGVESDILYLTSNLVPGYGTAQIQDTATQWASPESVPIPTPEPASLILMGSGLAGLGLWGRKKKSADKG